MRVLLKVGTVTAVLVAGIILSGIFYITLQTLSGGTASDQETRLTWNTKNTTRFAGEESADVQIAISQAAFTAQTQQTQPGSVVLVVGSDPMMAIAATSLMPYVNGPLFAVSSWPNNKIAGEIRRLSPTGTTEAAPIIVVGENAGDVAGSIGVELMRAEPIACRNGIEAATAIDRFKQERFGGIGNNVILAPADNFRLALPATSWAAHSGDSILFVSDRVPNEVRSRIGEREEPRLFSIGGIGSRVSNEFQAPFAETGARDVYANVVAFAKFRDAGSNFGWGMTGREQNAPSYNNFIIGNVDDWRNISSAAVFAKRGKYGCTLLAQSKRIPARIESFLWKQKPDFWFTPAEGPFNHAYIIGDLPSLDFLNVQGRVDWSQEIDHYRFQESGMSGLESLVLVWIAIGVLGSIWTLFAVLIYIPGIPLLMKIVWPMIVLILGPAGLIIFILSFHGRSRRKMGEMIMWERPSWNQAMVGTSMGIAFAASTMIAIAYLLTLFGLPLFQGIEFPAFYLGSPMVLMMIVMYIVAFLVSWLIFHIPMIANMRGISLRQAVGPAALVVFVAMTSVSAGMMTTTWWYQFWSLPSMAEEDNILWFGVLFFATLIGFVIAYVPNYLLVKFGKKSGSM